MELTRERCEGAYRVRRYDAGQLVINERTFETSLILTPETLVADWGPSHIDELVPEHVETVLALEPEVVLLGTGTSQRFPSRELLRLALDRGVGIEVMDTGGACRTFNILMAEGRRVAAALIV